MPGDTTTSRGRWPSAGIEVHAYDLRGFGGLERAASLRGALVDLHDDLGARLGGRAGGQPGVPLVLYGHSMGGLIVLGYVLSGRRDRSPTCWCSPLPGLDSTIAALEAARGTPARPDRAAAADPERLPARRPVPRSGRGRAAGGRSALPVRAPRPGMGAEAFAEQDGSWARRRWTPIRRARPTSSTAATTRSCRLGASAPLVERRSERDPPRVSGPPP